MLSLLFTVFLLLTSFATAQTIEVVLGQQDGVSQFTDLLTLSPDLVDYLNTGVHTLLVPTDAAINEAKSSMPEIFASNSSIRAFVEYHVLKDTHPSASISNISQLVPTLLNDTTYTNVTGGQRLELVRKDGQPTFLSAVKAESKISHADVFYVGGLIHIIDSALQIPLSLPETITKANLTNLVALLNKGNWLAPDSVAYKLALQQSDLTIFGPDGAEYGADFTGWDGKSQAELDEIFMYHALLEVFYTPELKNNTELQTLANRSIDARTYTASNKQSATFFDQAQLTGPNYITANGVLHVIDRPLDPNISGAAPLADDVNNAMGIQKPTAKRGITTAAIVGIVIGLIAVLLTLGIVLALRRRVKHKRQQQTSQLSRASPSDYRQMPPDYTTATQMPERTSRTISFVPAARLSQTLPPRPHSVSRSIASIRGALWPSRPAISNIVELDAKDYHVHVSEVDGSNSSDRDGTPEGSQMGRQPPQRPPRTPPELDGLQRSRRNSSPRSLVSITFHGDRPRHIGFQAQY